MGLTNMRSLLAALFLCLAGLTHVEAKPSLHGVDAFAGDRWELVAQAGTTAADVNRTMRCPPPYCARVKVKRKWKKHPRHERVKAAARPAAVIVPVPRVRPDDPPMDDEQAAAYRVIAELLAGGKIVVRPQPEKPKNIFVGFADEIVKAARRTRGVSLAGVVAPLVTKVHELMDKCGAVPISAVRRTYVRGSGRRSQHWDGRAVDIVGDPRCMYPLVAHWAGGVSTDYYRIRPNHMHISWGGREAGKRFAHYRGGVKRTRYARHHRHRYASAR